MLVKFNLILTLLLSLFTYAQVSSDTIFGKPKYVKEYVMFLNDSGPHTFMEGDDEYGHDVIMTPKNLRSRMRNTWFTTDFCRYTNNETFYDVNRNITKEMWYYKSEKSVGEYVYTYDKMGRLINEYSNRNDWGWKKTYYYQGKNRVPKFNKYQSKWGDEPLTSYLNQNREFFYTSKFDTITKIDSIFYLTTSIPGNLEEKGYLASKDSIIRPKLRSVNTYNEKMQLISSRGFSSNKDSNSTELTSSGITTYKYDDRGNVIEEATRSEENIHKYVLQKNGKYIETITPNKNRTSSTDKFLYDEHDQLIKESNFYGEKLITENIYTYKNNLIQSLSHFDHWGQKKKDKKPYLIIFKYKFDKHKNWIECVKNVDGKDLYVWKREIKYY